MKVGAFVRKICEKCRLIRMRGRIIHTNLLFVKKHKFINELKRK